MKIVAYKCPDTGNIFEHEKDYRNYRSKFLKQKRAHDNKESIKKSYRDWLAEEKLKITNVNMIAPWILANQKKLMEAANFFNLGTFGDKFKLDTDSYSKFEIDSVQYKDVVSNSHSCPHNGVTNWGGHREGAPRGYPGWECYVRGTLKRDRKDMSSYPYSNVCKFIKLHTGSGGGGNEGWGYDAKIFLDDWPGLNVQWEDTKQQAMFNKLKGIRNGNF